MLHIIKKDLPNFPNEVIEEWLMPYAKTIGWPPTNDRWVGILSARPLTFWRSTIWEQAKLDLSLITFSGETLNCFSGLRDAYLFGKDNSYARFIDNGKQRYLSALSYILRTGNFPKPIHLLLENNEYSIVDGNHRFTAWWAAAQMADAIIKTEKNGNSEATKQLRVSLAQKWNVEDIKLPSALQNVWIAKQ